MNAVVYTEYGPPDVLRLREVETPTPGDGEALVQVHAAAVNYSDWSFGCPVADCEVSRDPLGDHRRSSRTLYLQPGWLAHISWGL